MDTRTAHALIRFGLGRKGTEAPPSDMQAWLAAQLNAPDPVLSQPGATTLEGMLALQEQRNNKELRGEASPVRKIFRQEQVRYIDNLLTTDAPFRERLVAFWANHFTVSLKRGEVAAIVYPYIREAIRPHVTSRFVDMLQAVMRHPAMLLYLDNAQSFGPDSAVGKRQKKGLNENLARECLELHTVTPSSGYTQADVTAFANVLTGWSIELKMHPPGFVYRPFVHEPGTQIVMGQNFGEGQEAGIAALNWLGQHPSTYRNIATKLVRHFVADTPPPASVARVEAVLRETHGDLKAASLELTRLPDAWHPLTKLRGPVDYAVAVLRATGIQVDREKTTIPAQLAGLGQPLQTAPLPNGWPDTAADWAGSEAILRRIDWVYGLTARTQTMDPMEVATASLGPLLSPTTAEQIRLAGSRRDAMTLLLASPEFLRR